MYTATIIIVTYNGLKWIEKCLNSCKDYKVIVIDNASKDGTQEYIKNNFSQVHLIEQTNNLGFGQANNLGISIAVKEGAEFVFLLNQDAYLYHDTIPELINTYINNPEYGILSPIHLNGNGTKLDRNFSYYLDYDKNKYFYFDAVKNNLKEIYDVLFVNAAAWLLPLKTLKTVGGFDPLFFHYGEDDNYCQRILYQQYKIGVVTNTYVMHDRESRININEVKFSDQYFIKKELSYKVKFANINTLEVEKMFVQDLETINSLWLRSLLKLKFRQFKNYSNLKTILVKAYKDSSKSRIKNIEKSSHYLDI